MVGLEGMAIWYAMTAAVQFLMWCESKCCTTNKRCVAN